ncbi:MAG TPA: hypothetical protein VMR70_03050 [Flavisolibacter sp.]|nr:hypothetical protein [Flavisolibacter sp.]
MATFRNSILAIVGLFLFTKCDSEKFPDGTLPASSRSPLVKKQNSLACEWEYNNSIYYSAKLRLSADGTFDYRNETCYGQNFTKGKWKESGGSIMLTSDTSYRPVERTKTQKKFKETGLRGGQLIFIGFDETDTPKFPGQNDTIRVYFDNIVLNLKGDTLYSASNNKYIAEHKFSRVPENR